jgi:hypothetical protein
MASSLCNRPNSSRVSFSCKTHHVNDVMMRIIIQDFRDYAATGFVTSG